MSDVRSKLCVATTWSDAEIEAFDRINSSASGGYVYEVFASAPVSIVGSGRESGIVKNVTNDQMRAYIKKVQSHGIRFNYLLNGSCSGGLELTDEGYSNLLDYIDLFVEMGVDSFTVASPFLLEIIKANYPTMYVSISTIEHIDSLDEAQKWVGLGADRIIVSYMANRDFKLLEVLVRKAGAEIEVMANESCLYNCPLRRYHYNLTAHGSHCQTATIEYPFKYCSQKKVESPEELIKARWIRPEDLKIYHNLGIEYIKLAGREKTSEWLIECANHYAHRKSPDNLLDILAIVLPTGFKNNIFLSTEKLNNFIDHFVNGKANCRLNCGSACRYCHEIASKAVTITNYS